MSSFIMYFMMATLASSSGILFILLAKKTLKKHISIRCQYNLDLLFFVLLAVPFIPGSIFTSMNIRNWFNFHNYGVTTAANTTIVAGEVNQFTNGMGWLQDFSVSVDRAAPEYLPLILMGIWITGIAFFTVATFICNRNLRLIIESVKPVEDEEILSLFTQCKIELGIKKNILLGSSVLVKTPMTVGFFKTRIILPADKIFTSDTRYALLHELTHYKNGDIQINSSMCFFQVLYWFNPLVYFAFRQMRLDRELACDTSILKKLPKDCHIEYGKTLINFVKVVSRPSALCLAADMGGSKPQIIKRIKYIASFKNESAFIKVKSICVFILMGVLVFSQIPVISALAGNDDSRFHFHADNVLYEDLSSFFNGLEGSFVLYDIEAGLYTIHNREMSATRVHPFSTVKIISTLIALEEGVLDTNNTQREWDGTIYPFESWNQNQNLASAMQNSANWYFQDIDAQIGIEGLRSYLTRLSYGNRNLSRGILDLSHNPALRISPLEQVNLLRDLYKNNTIFEAGHVDTLKDILRLSESNGAVLSGKTGTGIVNGRYTNGWFIGFVENNGNAFVFATYIQGDNAGGSTAAQITLSILADMGIYLAFSHSEYVGQSIN